MTSWFEEKMGNRDIYLKAKLIPILNTIIADLFGAIVKLLA